jgi:hypothetical protein
MEKRTARKEKQQYGKKFNLILEWRETFSLSTE